MIYNLKSKTTSKIVGYTILTGSDSDYLSNSEILDSRLEAAIDDEYIPDDNYSWVKGKKKIGKLI